MTLPLQILLGFLLALLIAGLALRFGALSRSGALAALLTGALIFGLGGLPWATLLLAFFLTSTLLSRLFKRQKTGLDEKYAKGSRRDAGQVLANGGLASLFALLHAIFPSAPWPWIGFAASLAAVNADTWATELGVLSPSAPRLLTDLRRPVEKGASGGVSPWGTFASLLGASLIALLAVLLPPWRGPRLPAFFLLALAGLLGSLLDSLLGATLQSVYWCPSCRKETERHPLHTCGAPTAPLRGWPWLDNDWVNFLCSLLGALLAILWVV